VSILIVALPVALLVAAAAVAAFVWAARSGQYDDLETPAVRMLHDDDPEEETGPGCQDSSGHAADREKTPGDARDRPASESSGEIAGRDNAAEVNRCDRRPS
jgi:cbb3-type cytochrome oxidase maturation protein